MIPTIPPHIFGSAGDANSLNVRPGVSLSVSGLPSWLSFYSDTNTFWGTPTIVGRTDITLVYSGDLDELDHEREVLIILVLDPLPSGMILRTYLLGQFHTVVLRRPDDGVPPLTYSIVGSLPAGLSFRSDRRAIEGTPQETGSTDVDYVVTDANNQEIHRETVRILVISP